ncbi:NAD(P)/FAD-dependent oxidoreductase [Lacibacter sp.]|uniref:NAD(P)/FAD-dependent oxidoreductase n=1 Tax=Lacibacter sp. TaxID=1915409 RepID=UPI002B4B126B|nr:FAD-dependent oxidoreductase [Lacibacter sp.]HLP39160.1 FAD-dependent oxidoreductase [Lacibacter sp.]
MTDRHYDIAIIGGGLAGLALAIQSAKQGYAVVLFEKEKYPYHKVCGEYISLESWNFLESLGIPLSKLNLPVIKQLEVSSPNGNIFKHELPLGGFGISRYKLDEMLANIARQHNVLLLEETKVNDVIFQNKAFSIHSTAGEFTATVAAGCFGKRSNLDVKWNRNFVQQKPNKLNNYIGVKYHIKIDRPADVIALHNFENGYCGISQIEDGKFCLCYLTTAVNLQKSNNSIEQMEKTILCKNPQLKKIFDEAEFLYDSPVTISQISFEQKQLVEHHVLMIGDAGGMIAPLCGNGMSMAMHGSKLAFEQVHAFLQHEITRAQMEECYSRNWQQQFAKRLKTGRLIQGLFGKSSVTNLFINSVKTLPFLAKPLIRLTHGQSY